METIGYAALQVIPSMKGAQGVIQGELNGSLGAAGNTGGKSYGTGFLGTVGKYAKRATLIAGGIMTAKVIKGGIDRALNIDAARGKLQGLGHDAAAIDQIMGSALDAVSGTAFGLDAAATTAAGAVAAGIKPGKELTKYLSLTADAATIAGVSMNELGSIMNKVQTGQVAYTEDLNMLADRGIPVYQWLQKEYGVTAVELKKMVAAGKVDATTYRKVIEENIGGAAASSGATMRGTLANVGAAFSRLGASVVSGAFPQIKTGLGGVTEAVDAITPRVTSMASAAGGFITGTLVPAVQSAYDWFKTYLWPAISEGASTIGAALGPAIGSITTALGTLDGDGSSAAASIGTTLAGAITTAADAVAGIVSVVGPFVALLIEWHDVTVPLAATIIGVVAAYKAYQATMAGVIAVQRSYTATVTAVRAAQQAYAMGTYGMASGQKGLVAGIANTAGRIKTGVAAMGTWIASTARATAVNARWQLMLAKQGMARMVASLRAGVVAMGQWIAAQVRAAAVAVASAARATAAWVANTAVMVASRAAAVAFAAAQAVVRGAIVAATAVQWAWNAAMLANPLGLLVVAIVAVVAVVVLLWKKNEGFRKAVTAVWNAIKTAVVSAVGFVVGFVKKHWKTLLAIITGPIGIAVGLVIKHWDKIKAATSAAWNAIKRVLQTVWKGIRAVVTTYVNGVRTVITGVWNGVKAVTSTIWNGIRSAIATAVGGLVRLVTGMKDRVVGAVRGAATWLVNTGKNVVSGFIGGIKSMAGSLISSIKSTITDALPGYVKKALGIASPSRVFKALGRWIPRGMAKGITSSASSVEKAMDRVIKKMTRRANKAPKALRDSAKRWVKSIDKYLDKQTKGTRKIWRNRTAGQGTNRLLNSLTPSGKFKRGAKVQTATLKDFAKAREVLAKRLKNGRERLADAIAVRADFKASVVDSVRSFTSLMHAEGTTNAYGFQQAVTAGDITRTMRDRLKAVQKFNTDMAALLKAGLNKQTYKELIEAGPEAAADYAAALASGGPTAVAEVNSLNSQINKAANGLGNRSSNALYKAGVDTARGLVKGIQSQIKTVTKAAKRLTKSLTKAIKKALGIRSPSRVLAAIGRWVPSGLALGMGATSKVRQVTAAASALATTAADGVRSRLADVERAATAVSDAMTVHHMPTPDLPDVRPPWGGGGPDDGPVSGAAGARVVVQQTINNPQAEPTSKTVDAAARTLGLVGALP